MTSINVEHVCESVFEDPADGVVVGQVVVLPEVPVLVEVDGSVVGGEDVQVDGLTVVLGCRWDVLLQTVQQQGAWMVGGGETEKKESSVSEVEKEKQQSSFKWHESCETFPHLWESTESKGKNVKNNCFLTL